MRFAQNVFEVFEQSQMVLYCSPRNKVVRKKNCVKNFDPKKKNFLSTTFEHVDLFQKKFHKNVLAQISRNQFL